MYENARRAAVDLWSLKSQLWVAGQEKFYPTSREFKAIAGLCWRDPTDGIRSLADDAACRYADVHGDSLFKRNVDGTDLAAVTKWFYGTLPEPILRIRTNRTRQFSAEQLRLLEAVDRKAQSFIGCTRLLPFTNRARLAIEERQWNARYNKAREMVVRCSPACQGYLWLLNERRLPQCVALEVKAFEGSV